MTDALRTAAEAALARLHARQHENIKEWARQLAADLVAVGEAERAALAEARQPAGEFAPDHARWFAGAFTDGLDLPDEVRETIGQRALKFCNQRREYDQARGRRAGLEEAARRADAWAEAVAEQVLKAEANEAEVTVHYLKGSEHAARSLARAIRDFLPEEPRHG